MQPLITKEIHSACHTTDFSWCTKSADKIGYAEDYRTVTDALQGAAKKVAP